MYIIIWNSEYLPWTAIYDPYKHSAGHDEPKFPPGTISAHDSCLRLYSYSDSPVIYSLQYCTAVRELRAEIKKQALMIVLWAAQYWYDLSMFNFVIPIMCNVPFVSWNEMDKNAAQGWSGL